MARQSRLAGPVAIFLLAIGTVDPPVSAQPAPTAPPHGSLVPPRLVAEPSVPYPAGPNGEAKVVLVITVNADGSVRSATPVQPSQEPFASQAMRVAMTWRFEPAERDGEHVAARIRVEVSFQPLAPSPRQAPERPVGTTTAAPAQPAQEEVLVRGAREEPSLTATLSRSEVRQIPGTFGDPFRAIEVMPGVTPIVSGLPFFFVRGAPPGDVGYFVDEIRVPYLFHIGAGPSVIHPAILDRVDLYPGGYPARFGRFAGGIVSGETTTPAEVLHGEYNVRLFDAGALAETPFSGGRGTILVGGRYSYTALLLSLASPSSILDYWDYQARATYDVTPRDRASLVAFGARDYLAQKGTPRGTQTIFDTQFHRLDLRDDHVIDDRGTVRAALTGGLDLTVVGTGIYVRDRLIGARDAVSYRLSPTALLRAGADAQLDVYDVVVGSGSDQASLQSSFPSRTDTMLGAHADVALDVAAGLQVTPGARIDFFASGGATAAAVDPRLSARTTVTHRARLLAALGLAHQLPAFIIPVPGFQPGGLHGGLQTAAQESMGVEVDIDRGTKATATVFHNAFFNMSDALDIRVVRADGTSDAQTVVEARTDGSAYGLEIFVNRKVTKRIGGLLSYTLSRSVRIANGQRFIAPFDRTHVLNAAAAYDLGRNWRAGTRIIFYTGLPKAPDVIDKSTRLSPFFRLDLRIEKRWQIGQRSWISFVAEWMNATLTKEAVGTNCTLNGCRENSIGPVTLPSIGVEGGI